VFSSFFPLTIKGILLCIVFEFGIEKSMHTVNKIKNKAKVTTLLSLVIILIVAGVSTPLIILSQTASAQSFIDRESDFKPEPKAPMAVSSDGNNVYIVWWTNKSENWEVMFRASNDGGQTFGDKINLSNSSDTESQNAEIVAAGDNSVFVSWWETSPETGSSESVLRVSNDGGQTFGPMIMLGMNGTINTTSEGDGIAANDTTQTMTSNTTITGVEEQGVIGEEQQQQLSPEEEQQAIEETAPAMPTTE
jgi:uncharacterized protein (UPF0333 family)